MANSVVGYTNDITGEKIVYTGGKTDADVEKGVLASDVRIDNDPESNTYREIRVVVSGNDLTQADWGQTDENAANFIKNKPFTNVGDGLSISNMELKLNKDVGDLPAIVKEHTTVINELNVHFDKVDNKLEDLELLKESKQDKLLSGENIKTVNGIKLLGKGNIVIEGTDNNYLSLDNKPSINNITVKGDMTLDELGIQQKMIAGSNVKIEDNIISSDDLMGIDFTTDNTVGGLVAGTEIKATDSVRDILYKILKTGE